MLNPDPHYAFSKTHRLGGMARSKESTPKGRGLEMPLKGGYRYKILDIGYLISNAKAQISNECQRPKSKTEINLTETFRHLIILALLDLGCFTMGSFLGDNRYNDRLEKIKPII